MGWWTKPTERRPRLALNIRAPRGWTKPTERRPPPAGQLPAGNDDDVDDQSIANDIPPGRGPEQYYMGTDDEGEEDFHQEDLRQEATIVSNLHL